jgi:hypothetical protein
MGKKRINADLSEDLYTRLKAFSVESGLTMSSLVIYSVMNFLDQKEVLKMNSLYEKFQREEIKAQSENILKK